jgi:hypothetical protein
LGTLPLEEANPLAGAQRNTVVTFHGMAEILQTSVRHFKVCVTPRTPPVCVSDREESGSS